MSPLRRWRLAREHRWFQANKAHLFGGDTDVFAPDCRTVAGDRRVLGVLALAESEHLQQMLRTCGGSVARMLAEMSVPDREHLAAQVRSICQPVAEGEC